MSRKGIQHCIGLLILTLFVFSENAFAVKPTVKAVPWVATNPLIPHDTWTGRSITLKGATDIQGPNFQWTWDFGDGTPVATGVVSNKYVIEASHIYTGATGLVFTALLTLQDTSYRRVVKQALLRDHSRQDSAG